MPATAIRALDPEHLLARRADCGIEQCALDLVQGRGRSLGKRRANLRRTKRSVRVAAAVAGRRVHLSHKWLLSGVPA
jgi:hypothetical protein